MSESDLTLIEGRNGVEELKRPQVPDLRVNDHLQSERVKHARHDRVKLVKFVYGLNIKRGKTV